MISISKFTWSPDMNGIPHRLMLGPTLLNVFINDSGNGVETTLKKFTVNVKLGVATQSEYSTCYRNLNMLEKWAHRKIMNFSKEKCHVLHPCRNNTRNQYRLWSHVTGKHLEKQDQDKILSMMHHSKKLFVQKQRTFKVVPFIREKNLK